LPLPLNLIPNPFIGLSMEAGVIEPSFELSIEVIVPFREDIEELFIDKEPSARSNMLPPNIEV
jgi:hypothetical protein